MNDTSSEKVRQDILDAIMAGCSPSEMSQILGIPTANVQYYLKAMKRERVIKSTGYGKYAITNGNGNGNGHHEPPAVKPATNGNARIAENASRKVALPEYMRSRNAVTLYVEHSPTEIESVMRFELQMGGIWIPIPVSSDLRVCVGDDIPRWSATQEIYNGVTMMRVTLRSGEQNDYAHNPQVPVTVDVK